MKSYTACMYTYIHITHCLYRCIQRWWHLQEDTEKTTERKIYVCIYLHTQLYTLQLYSPSQKKNFADYALDESQKKITSFSSDIHVGVHLIRVQKKGEGSRGFTSLQFATRDPSFMINFTYLTGRLQFLNSTPQHDERTTLSAASLGLLEDRQEFLIRPLVKLVALPKL